MWGPLGAGSAMGRAGAGLATTGDTPECWEVKGSGSKE
eukprot:CAMPEP_0118994172 /NCGR_PEP_ID=MMETSP1173-20130426/56416_1 /TAXON_ID=1034831 /ORGANISM="Rhizochromulina marina cf, Strain CCMP1243" /LENGTH=37 /DNA_ID= /DNA_START= /DNA_END= /DNA_ORIENTATION=